MAAGMAPISGNQGGAQLQGLRSLRETSEGKATDKQFEAELKKLVEELMKVLDPSKAQGASAAQNQGGPAAQNLGGPAGSKAGQGAQQASGPSSAQESGDGALSLEELFEKLRKLLDDPRAVDALKKLAAQDPNAMGALQQISAALGASGGGGAQGVSAK